VGSRSGGGGPGGVVAPTPASHTPAARGAPDAAVLRSGDSRGSGAAGAPPGSGGRESDGDAGAGGAGPWHLTPEAHIRSRGAPSPSSGASRVASPSSGASRVASPPACVSPDRSEEQTRPPRGAGRGAGGA
jgi:hypothetical protein